MASPIARPIPSITPAITPELAAGRITRKTVSYTHLTLNFDKNDVRITTKYLTHNLASSMYSVIHESGHALYELGIGDEYQHTSLAGGVSMGVHESQSRLYENMLGRSEPFIQLIFPKLQELFPEQLAGVTPHQLYLAVNKAQQMCIRDRITPEPSAEYSLT